MDTTIVQVEGIVKVFGGEIRALDGISLAVEPGIIYGLLGPNGAGKTTLIRVLATLLPSDEGTARVAGFDVRRDPGEVRARIGLAGQYAAVDEFLTGWENVEMVGFRSVRSHANACARRARISAIQKITSAFTGCSAASAEMIPPRRLGSSP